MQPKPQAALPLSRHIRLGDRRADKVLASADSCGSRKRLLHRLRNHYYADKRIEGASGHNVGAQGFWPAVGDKLAPAVGCSGPGQPLAANRRRAARP